MSVHISYTCRECGRETGEYQIDTFARIAAAIHTFRAHYEHVRDISLLGQILGTLRWIFRRAT